MKTSIEYVIFLSFFISLLMAGLSFAAFKRLKVKGFSHLSELWLSLSTLALASFVFRSDQYHIVALSMVGWIWPLRGFRFLLEDLSDHKLMQKWEYIILSVGGFLSVALGSYGQSFFIYTAPFALSVGIVGLTLVKDAFKETPEDIFTPTHSVLYSLSGLFFITLLAFPFWRVTYPVIGFTFLLISIVGIGVCCLSVYLEMMKIKHEKQVDGLLKERNDKLFSQSKYSELGMMSAGIAHEINNPLAVIQARTTQLLRVYRDPNRQKDLGEGLQQILYTSERITRTIQGIREFVHQDEKGSDSTILIKDLVDDVLSFCGQRLKNHGVNLRLYGLEKSSVKGHKIQLEQVILNLINNSFDAIEYLPDKWIEISVQETPHFTQIFVKDSGHGIPPQISERMMDPFFSTKDIGKGTGLGLALAKGIIEKHEGHLKYLNNTHHTTFVIELPRLFVEREWELPTMH